MASMWCLWTPRAVCTTTSRSCTRSLCLSTKTTQISCSLWARRSLGMTVRCCDIVSSTVCGNSVREQRGEIHANLLRCMRTNFETGCCMLCFSLASVPGTLRCRSVNTAPSARLRVPDTTAVPPVDGFGKRTLLQACTAKKRYKKRSNRRLRCADPCSHCSRQMSTRQHVRFCDSVSRLIFKIGA
jgi:hypothetical protein